MNDTTFSSILNGVLANGDNYLCVALFLVLLVRQIRFEQYCYKQFAALHAQLEAFRAEVRDILKDMDYKFKINDYKHESYEAQFKRLEAERVGKS